jgi:GntR family transcriptional regulator
LLENKYDTPLVEAEYKLEAAAADPVAAHALQVPPGSPIFLIERTSYTTGNRLVDYERLHYRGDLIRFVTRLARRPRKEFAVVGRSNASWPRSYPSGGGRLDGLGA